jgi:hypothetical protein
MVWRRVGILQSRRRTRSTSRWDQRYQEGSDGWKLGQPAPSLARFLRSHPLAPEVDAFYWTVLAPDIVNPGREEQGSFSV